MGCAVVLYAVTWQTLWKQTWVCIENKIAFKTTQKLRDKPRPVATQNGTRHVIVKYGTILCYKGWLATVCLCLNGPIRLPPSLQKAKSFRSNFKSAALKWRESSPKSVSQPQLSIILFLSDPMWFFFLSFRPIWMNCVLEILVSLVEGEKKGTYAGVSSLPSASSSGELTFSRPPGDNMLTHTRAPTHTSRKAERLRRTRELVNIC